MIPAALALTISLAGCAPASAPQSSVTPTGTSETGGQATGPEWVSPSPTPSPTPTFVPREVTINVSGDLLWHNTLWKSAELDARQAGGSGMDFYPQLSGLTRYVSGADMAICHSEVPFAPEGGPYQNYPLFAAPPQIAPALQQVGWDLCTTASNHTMDAGWDGLVRTIAVHNDNGILTAGSYATEEAAATPVIYTTADGVKVAVISQTYGLNGLPKAKDKPWSVQLIDADVAIADARKAREAGADIVTVHIHAGDEYSSSLNKQQKEFAEAVTASGEVDFVFGQHAHVVQPIDNVNGVWVFYGSGNLIASSGPAKPRSYDGYVGQVTFEERPDGRFVATAAEFAPTMITKYGGGKAARVLLIADALREGVGSASDLEASAERTRTTVRALGVEGLTERE